MNCIVCVVNRGSLSQFFLSTYNFDLFSSDFWILIVCLLYMGVNDWKLASMLVFMSLPLHVHILFSSVLYVLLLHWLGKDLVSLIEFHHNCALKDYELGKP